MYAMLGSRPDQCLSISYFSRFQDNPSEHHWKHLKTILRYIKGALNLKLVYTKSNINQNELIGYADANWTNDVIDRKSVNVYIFKVFDCTVSQATRKQQSVALSSTESEYISLGEATEEAIQLKGILSLFNIIINHSIIIYEDNQGCIELGNIRMNTLYAQIILISDITSFRNRQALEPSNQNTLTHQNNKLTCSLSHFQRVN